MLRHSEIWFCAPHKGVMRYFMVWYGNGAAVVWFGMVRYGMGGYSEDKWVLTIRIMARPGWH